MIGECSKSYLLREKRNPFNFTISYMEAEYIIRYPGFGKLVLVGRIVEKIGNKLPEDINSDHEGVIKLGEDELPTGEYVRFERTPKETEEKIIKNLGK